MCIRDRYCNVVTLTLTVTPAGFALDGHDDQCGASTRGSATGQVTLNPNGTAGVNFTTVTSPGGKGIHVSGVVSIGTGQGTWTDSVGNSGTFVLGGAVTGLPVRPVAASGLAPVTLDQIDMAHLHAHQTGIQSRHQRRRAVVQPAPPLGVAGDPAI